MRIIKFRGKDIETGEWVYGDLHVLCDRPHIHHTEQTAYPYAGKRSFVDLETIGQFTGLVDKNGKEIYEGDIIKEDNLIHKILWIDEASAFCRCDLEYMDIRYRISRDAMSYVEIIGNVFDNTELLKGGKQ